MRRIWVPTVVVMAAAAAYLGWSLSRPRNEGEVIAHYAALYVAAVGDGARVTDCVGVPDRRDEVWMRIECAHPGGGYARYFIGPDGAALNLEGGPET